MSVCMCVFAWVPLTWLISWIISGLSVNNAYCPLTLKEPTHLPKLWRRSHLVISWCYRLCRIKSKSSFCQTNGLYLVLSHCCSEYCLDSHVVNLVKCHENCDVEVLKSLLLHVSVCWQWKSHCKKPGFKCKSYPAYYITQLNTRCQSRHDPMYTYKCFS